MSSNLSYCYMSHSACSDSKKGTCYTVYCVIRHHMLCGHLYSLHNSIKGNKPGDINIVHVSFISFFFTFTFLVFFLQHLPLKKPPFPRLLEQLSQLEWSQSAATYNTPLISQVMEQLPHQSS